MLRYYQQAAVDSCYDFLANSSKNPCIVIPTGGGKTLVIAQICKDANGWGGRVLVLAHTKELLEQSRDKIESLSGLNVGVYSASLNSRDTRSDVLVAGVQSVYKRGLELCGAKPFNLVLVDEAHRIPTGGEGMYRQLLSDLHAANPKVRVVGLTATPYRTGTGYVCSDEHLLNEVCYEVGIKELIAGGFLCPLSSKRGKSTVDMDDARVQRGDFVQAEMEARFSDEDKVSGAVAEILHRTKDRNKVLVFCCGIAHATDVAMRLEESGQSVRIVSSEHEGRSQSIEAFKAGRCKFLVNVNVLTEGFDSPDIDCVALLRSTISPGLYYQMVGRGLRTSPGKQDCLILDFGGNIQRHGPLDQLSIKPRSSGGKSGEAPGKACPECDEMIHAGLLVCSCCGYEFPPNEPNHEAEAAEDSPLGGGGPKEYQVSDVVYSYHRSKQKKDQPEKPPSMRVTYYDGLGIVAEEWICLEHSGFAWEKAHSWWRKRSKVPPPKTIEQAVAFAQAGALAPVCAVTLQENPKNNRFPNIIKHELGDVPEPPVIDEDTTEDDWIEDDLNSQVLSQSEIPF